MNKIPNHIGIIPDGNRRYAEREGISLKNSYIHGAEIALQISDIAKNIGVKHVSFFGTSSENVLCRPKREMAALRQGVLFFCNTALSLGHSLHLVGDIEAIGQTPKEKNEFLKLKRMSRSEGNFVIHADVNYSGEIRNELGPLFKAIVKHGLRKVRARPEEFISSADVPPIDLTIRVGGKQRLSGFLPFQNIYAELYFREELWGDFTEGMFRKALDWYVKQDRNKGA